MFFAGFGSGSVMIRTAATIFYKIFTKRKIKKTNFTFINFYFILTIKLFSKIMIYPHYYHGVWLNKYVRLNKILCYFITN